MENNSTPENALSVFMYHSQEMRTVLDEDGEPWFVAKDLCEILGYSDTSVTVSRLDDDEKGTRKVCTLRGTQELLVINESGLYTLILRSNKPEAKPFRKWVTGVVLPSIRKTGSYTIPAAEVTKATEEYRKNVRSIVSVIKTLNATREPTMRKLLWEMVKDGAARMGYPVQGELSLEGGES